MVIKSIYKAFWNLREADLGSNEAACQDCPRLILATAIYGMEYSGLKIVMKSSREVVRCGQLMIDGTGHAIDK